MIRSCFISDSDTEYALACMQRDSGLGKSELIRALVRAACHPNGLLGAIAAQCRPVMETSVEDTGNDSSDIVALGVT